MEFDQLGMLIDNLSASSWVWFELAEKIKSREATDPQLLKINQAYYYDLSLKNDGYRWEEFGTYAPMVEFQEGSFPPRLDQLPQDTLTAWLEIFPYVNQPLAKSRLADLLWIKKASDSPITYANIAIESYLELAENKIEELEIPISLGRALELCKETNNDKQRLKILVKNNVLLTNALNNPEMKEVPGIVLRYIDNLLTTIDKTNKADASNFIDRAIELYDGNTYILEILLKHKMRTNPESKTNNYRLMVKLLVDDASNATSTLSRNHFFVEALEKANEGGLIKEKEEIRKCLQDSSLKNEELHFIEKEFKITNQEMEKMFSYFTKAKSWPEAIDLFGAYKPINTKEENTAFIEELEKKDPLLFLVTRQVYDHNNLLIYVCRTEEQSRAITLIGHEMLQINIFSPMASIILARLMNKLGELSSDIIIKVFSTPIISSELAQAYTKAIPWYWKNEFSIFASLIIPVIESSLRDLSKKLGIPVYYEPVGETYGGLRILSHLLKQLEKLVPDSSWIRYYKDVLIEQAGLNIRNRLFHGQTFDITKEEASLLFHIACSLTLIRITESPSVNNSDNSGEQ